MATSVNAADWEYTVLPGDSLWSLGEQYLNKPEMWSDIQNRNELDDADKIEPGDTLLIPIELLRMEPAAALVDAVFGMATVSSGANQRPVEAGMLLESGDTLTTNPGATVTVVFDDGIKVLVEGGTVLAFSAIRSFKPARLGAQRIELESGGIETTIPKDKAGRNRFFIRTRAAELRARGTVYRVRVAGLTIAETISGSVVIAGSGTARDIAAQMGTRAEAGKAPEKPRPLPPTPNIANLSTVLTERPIRFALPLPSGIAAHRVQVSGDEFNSLLFDGVTRTAQLPSPDDLPNGDYAMRVRAIDDTGLEGINAVHYFTLAVRSARPLIYLRRLPERPTVPPPAELPEYFGDAP